MGWWPETPSAPRHNPPDAVQPLPWRFRRQSQRPKFPCWGTAPALPGRNCCCPGANSVSAICLVALQTDRITGIRSTRPSPQRISDRPIRPLASQPMRVVKTRKFTRPLPRRLMPMKCSGLYSTGISGRIRLSIQPITVQISQIINMIGASTISPVRKLPRRRAKGADRWFICHRVAPFGLR